MLSSFEFPKDYQDDHEIEDLVQLRNPNESDMIFVRNYIINVI